MRDGGDVRSDQRNWGRFRTWSKYLLLVLFLQPLLSAISQGGLLCVMDHPNRTKYGHQKMLVVRIRDYAYLVPYVESESDIFLKSIMPSRKATRDFLSGEK